MRNCLIVAVLLGVAFFAVNHGDAQERSTAKPKGAGPAHAAAEDGAAEDGAAQAATDDVATANDTKPEDVGMSSAGMQKLADELQEEVEGKRLVGMSLVVGRRGKIIHRRGYGYRNWASKTPMTSDTVVRLYSMSKPLTTVAAIRMWEEGKFKLEDPITDVLPELKDRQVLKKNDEGEWELTPTETPITFRNLMQHTAGFGYGVPALPFGDERVERRYRAANLFNPETTLADMLLKLEKLPLAFEPGSRFYYSLSIDLLGLAMERMDGRPLDDVMRDRLFEPLGMKDSGFHVPEGAVDRFASVHSQLPGVGTVVIRPAQNSPFLKRPNLFLGGNGLVSSAEDYAQFCLMLMNRGEHEGKQFLRPETVEMITTGQLPEKAKKSGRSQRRTGRDFGYGFAVRTEANKGDSSASMGEFGWGGAANTFFWCDPKTEIFVVMMRQVMPMSLSLEGRIKPILNESIIPEDSAAQ